MKFYQTNSLHNRFVYYEANFGKDHPEVAADQINLASLLEKTNWLSEAEPLMRRALEIFLKFTASTRHPHPFVSNANRNYQHLLSEMGRDPAEIKKEIQTLYANHGLTIDSE